MFEALADRLKSEAAYVKSQATYSIRAIVILAVAALAVVVAIGFLIAALFVRLAHVFGPIEACLACAGLFLVLALTAMGINGILSARHKRMEEARRAALAAAAPSMLSDPRLIMVGVQVAQAIGFKRLLPLLAVGGAAFVLVARSRTRGSGAAP